MTYSPPRYSKSRVDSAGDALAKENFGEDDLEVVNNWRFAHALPLNVMYTTLHRRATRLDQTALVSQRMKRVTSVALKLRRHNGMKLSRMQDLGGCRAVLLTARHVEQLRTKYNRIRSAAFENPKEYDYIVAPKPDGYRGVHLVFSYRGRADPGFLGLKIEMQLRTRLQHAWATAVETVDTVLRQGLKIGGGEPQWKRFFALAGSMHSNQEGTPMVPGTPPSRFELSTEMRDLAADLSVEHHLNAVREAMTQVQATSIQGAKYYLLMLSRDQVEVRGFKSNELALANRLALDAERSGANAVVVSVESVEALHEAYPSYFLDTEVFLDSIRSEL